MTGTGTEGYAILIALIVTALFCWAMIAWAKRWDKR